ncbi:hypothetical protein B0H21DRAFT_710232 [Amylocystis lapponica]|nr:hypothetical protein B0H21DRAFT_710232 [Amylocystis lapponica]
MSRRNTTTAHANANRLAPMHSPSRSPSASPAPHTGKHKRPQDDVSGQRTAREGQHGRKRAGRPNDSGSSDFERASQQDSRNVHNDNGENSHGGEEEDSEEEALQPRGMACGSAETSPPVDEPHGHKFLAIVAEMSRRSSKNSPQNPLKPYKKAARYIPRTIGPFENIAQAFQIGLHTDEADDGDHDEDVLGLDPDARAHAKSVYDSILTITPGLSSKIWVLGDDLEAVTSLIDFFDHNQQSARTDNVSSMKTNILDFLPDLDTEINITNLSSKTPKEQRGFHHHATGRLLCPRILRDEFDKDMEKFCRKVHNCEIDIEADDYPSFLYPDRLDEHLLRSEFLVQCFRCLFLGPSKAKGNSGSNGGRPSIAKLYNITNITPFMIAYVVVLARFALSSSPRWDEHNGNFSLVELFDNVVHLFTDEKWSTATLEWWNIQVLGTKPQSAVA